MSIQYTLSSLRFQEKPEDEQLPSICRNSEQIASTVEYLIEAIERGQTFWGCTFTSPSRRKHAFQSQQIFGLDFDETITLQEAEHILRDFNLQYAFGYYTFSHQSEQRPRFRLLFILNKPLENRKLAGKILRGFKALFDSSTDYHTVNPNRAWYGTNHQCFVGNISKRYSIEELVAILNFKIYFGDDDRSRSCITLDSEFGEKADFLYNNDKDSPIYPKNESTGKKIEKPNWDELQEYEIVRRFFNGEGSGFPEKLIHGELLGLATNFLQLDGGEARFKECLDKNPHYSEDKYSLISYCKNNDYQPMLLRNFSPYEQDKNHQYQTFYQLLRRKGRIEILYEPVLETLDMAEQRLKDTFDDIFSTFDNKIHVVKAAPGLGKSRYVIGQKGILIGFPNHNLKAEQSNKSSLKDGVEKFCSPDVAGVFSSKLDSYFAAHYDKDLGRRVIADIKRLADGEYVISGQIPPDIEAARQYLRELQTTKENPAASVFTTHARAIKEADWSYDRIVLDESPMETIFEIHKAKVDELRIVANRLHLANLHRLLDKETGEVQETPSFNVDPDDLHEIAVQNKFSSHAIRFFRSDAYVIERSEKAGECVHYIIDNRRLINSLKQYIICDATACQTVYEKAFGDRVVFHDISNVKNKGLINQYTSRSCSKDGLSRYFDKVPIDCSIPTITFKHLKHTVPNACEQMHFGATRGSNGHEGKDVNILGTYHVNTNYFRLLSKVLDLGVNSFKMENQSVTYEERRFVFHTFSDPNIQRIHLEMVEAEALQAAHRPRLLRYPVTANVYSNFPLRQANYIY